MRQASGSVTRFLRSAGALAGLLFIAACAAPPPPSSGGGGGGSAAAPAPEAPKAAEARRVDPNQRVTVALLTPTNSADKRARAVAEDLVAAAQIARQDSGDPLLMMKVYDTKGDPDTAAEVARVALDEGAAIIIGPLRGVSALAVGPVAAERGVNVLAFSNDTSVAGENVWVLGQLPGEELRRVLGYAAARGVDRVAITYPTNRYGDLMAAEAGKAGAEMGVSVGPYLPYERSFKGIEGSAEASAAAISDEGANGVLIADAGDALRATASFLRYYDVKKDEVQFLGASRWSDRKNIKESALAGGWFAAADPEAQAAFAAKFRATMGRAPSPLASIGYEAMTIVADMLATARASGSDDAFGKSALVRPGGFDGVAGPIRLTPDGLNRRGLAVMEVTPKGLMMIDPPQVLGPGA